MQVLQLIVVVVFAASNCHGAGGEEPAVEAQEGVSRRGGPGPVRAGPGVAPQAGPAPKTRDGEVSMMTVDDVVELRPFAGPGRCLQADVVDRASRPRAVQFHLEEAASSGTI